jgi:hypothetical protein
MRGFVAWLHGVCGAVEPAVSTLIPYTLVLKPGLVIHSVYNGYWFWGRPSIVDRWHDLRAVTREIRPGWDLASLGCATPGTRAIARPSTGSSERASTAPAKTPPTSRGPPPRVTLPSA